MKNRVVSLIRLVISLSIIQDPGIIPLPILVAICKTKLSYQFHLENLSLFHI